MQLRCLHDGEGLPGWWRASPDGALGKFVDGDMIVEVTHVIWRDGTASQRSDSWGCRCLRHR
jgi:hypothetical protein